MPRPTEIETPMKMTAFDRFFAGQALPSASRATVAVAALLLPARHHAANPLTLDNFKSGHYLVSLTTAQSQDIHFAPSHRRRSPRPRSRNSLCDRGQSIRATDTLDIGKGIWIVDGGFGVVPGVQIYYGWANATTPAPLGLNLAAIPPSD